MKKKILSVVLVIVIVGMSVGVLAYQHLSEVVSLKQTLSQSLQPQTEENIIFDLAVVPKVLSTLESINNSKIAIHFLPVSYKSLLDTLLTYKVEISTVVEQLSSQQQKWIIIFQNSNELRATGGFMGSYSIIDINQGKIVSITTEDIYDADGQFPGFVDPPHGVKEYLSSGNGLRLPDANWNPDTKKSSQQVLHFFALGNKQNVSGVIFVNLDFAKALLDYLGPIEIQDYNTVVTSQNIDEVLRSRRSDFFPGSTQKKHMLSQLLTQVRIKLLETTPEKLSELLTLLEKQIAIQNLQFYSNDQTIDSIFTKNHMRQELLATEESDYLYFLESNVGINKANKNISREIEIMKKNNSRTITAYFSNNNTKPTTSKLTDVLETDLPQDTTNHLAYINYQRVIVPESWKLNSIQYQNIEISPIHEEKFKTENNVTLKEIGFLITLAEQESSVLSLDFTTAQSHDEIYVQKQPGVPPINYTLQTTDTTVSQTIENNSLLQYP